jgi:adenylate kinase
MEMKYRTVLLFGAPGSGKGTQGKIIGAIPDFFHFACGDAFRNLRINDPLGRIFVEYSSRGQLVPDQHVIDLWRRNIQASTVDGGFDPERDTLVLDGIPRNVAQAEMLSSTLDVRALIHLTCADQDKMVERLQRRALRENRLDDANLEVIRQRLATSEAETKPVLDFYGPRIVRDVDSTQPPVFVLRDIIQVLVTSTA